ncbi:MAG: Gfo/Idh/MocA family oxidoreductase [Spirochaetales bacterium]|nr:Gfo/Idh/MocA family oxidoreductase [Spirochaetales bacterium]
MKVAIIGSTGHYGYALDGIQHMLDAHVTAIAPGAPGESIDGLAGTLKENGHNPLIMDDYRKVLDELKPDFAVVNTHFHLQAEVTAEVLGRNIHAFTEKPVATTMKDLEALEEAHKASDGELIAMLGIRYEPCFYTAWKKVKSGAIGDVRMLHAQKSYRLGSREDLYKKRSTYGGTIPWVGIHAIDWIQWFGGDGFLSVDARHSVKYNNGHGELETSAAAMFTMEDGVFATVNIDYLRPENAASHGDDRIRAAGTKGVIEVRGDNAYLINDEAQGEQILPLESPGNIFESFVNSISGDGECLLSAEQSFRATRLGLLARQSADEERPLPIE